MKAKTSPIKKKPIILKSNLSEPRGIDVNPYFAMIGFIGWIIAMVCILYYI